MKIQTVSVTFLSLFTLAAGLVSPARAENFKLPDKHPVVSVT